MANDLNKSIIAGTKQGMSFLGDPLSKPAGKRVLGLISVEDAKDGGDITALAADDSAAWGTFTAATTKTPKFTLYTKPADFETASGVDDLASNIPGVKTFSGNGAQKVSFAYITTKTDVDSKAEVRVIVVYYGLTVKPTAATFGTGTTNAVQFEYESTATDVEFTDEKGNLKHTPMLTIEETNPNFNHWLTTLFGTNQATGEGATLVLPDDVSTYKPAANGGN